MLSKCRLLWMGAVTGVLLILFLLSTGLLAAPAGASDQRAFQYKSYKETLRFFEDLKRKYPDLVDTWYAQEVFPNILPSRAVWATCEGEPCKTLIVRIANKKLLTNSTPEVFLSGALHGDERVGPLSVTELAVFLTEQYRAGNEDVKRLVDFRATWITPTTNAFGYANNRRDENNMDPNRDFAYLQNPQRCMQTQTARAVNELFRNHLFQFMLTFHGGMRALTYEWGSRNHMVGRKSTESPDFQAFKTTGELLLGASGKDRSGSWWYPLGPINDMVYPVDGGMEDWSYGAGWESSPSPITVCRPTTYGGYGADRTIYKKDSIATLVYLAEMDDAKTPRSSTLGHVSEIWHPEATGQGHVPRNLRMCLKLIELAKPEIVVLQNSLPPATASPKSEIGITVHGFGCQSVDTLRLLLVPKETLPNCDFGSRATGGEVLDDAGRAAILKKARILKELHGQKCRGLTGIWEPSTPAASIRLQGQLPDGVTGSMCLLVSAEFDQHWSKQAHPDPNVKPRAFATRSRIEEHFSVTANDGGMMIKSFKTKFFAVRSEPLNILATQTSAAPTSTLRPAVATNLPGTAPATSAAVSSSTRLPLIAKTESMPGLRSSEQTQQAGGTNAISPVSGVGAEKPVLLGGIPLRGLAIVSLLGIVASILLCRGFRQARQPSGSPGRDVGADVVGSAHDDEEVQLTTLGPAE
eukprot:TRINITY_DN9715_c0_g6_i1.p1 TRINITY_DN9715_c0_g6~~TRINITY_DN9715_c0_g6_i1.p1  ORF type:complete len:695 (+),score=84.96 TRINITY_DN9715_c0_g6_i1:23-2107(+)